MVDDLATLATAGVPHAYVTLPSAAGSIDELLEGAARLRAAWKETGQDH